MMTRQRVLLAIASAALGLALFAVLIKLSKINLWVTLHELRGISRISLAQIVLLTGLHIFLSNLKWRTIDTVVRHASDSAPSRSASFAFTSVGVAFGQVLPVQLSMSAARTFGTYFHGGALKRGTVGTLFEQGFDVLIVAFLSVASAATWLYKGGATIWMLSAATMTFCALVCMGPAVQLIQRVLSHRSESTALASKTRRGFAILRQSEFVNARLARRLMLLSAARFVVQIAMWYQTAEAIGAHIPFWQLGAALPFVIVTFALSATPGGLGLSDLTSVTALKLFGTPLSVGTPWAIASRLFITISSFIVAIAAVILLLLMKLVTRRHAARSLGT